MKTTSSNLDFWDEPLPAAGLRRLLRGGPVPRHARVASLAPARRLRRRAWSAAASPASRAPRRSGRR